MNSFESSLPIPNNDPETSESQSGSEIEIELNEKMEKVDGIKQALFLEINTKPSDIKNIKRIYGSLEAEIANAQVFLMMELSKDHPKYEFLKELRSTAELETNMLLQGSFDEEISKIEMPLSAPSAERVEKDANYSGDNTLLMIDRLNNPEINTQLAYVLYLDRKYDLNIEDSPSFEDVRKMEAEIISAIAKDTPITFTGEMSYANSMDGERETIDSLWEIPEVFGENGTTQKNITEAHEKGHTVRKVRSGVARTFFGRGLDLASIQIPTERLQQYAKHFFKEDKEGNMPTEKEVYDSILDYLGSPMEVIERMAQLKNYFGIADNGIFTKQHLQYAREHYVEDTKMDNHMTEFFQAITPETEDAFLEIINKTGI